MSLLEYGTPRTGLQLSSLWFLLILLPLFLFAYYLVPTRWRMPVLAALSAVYCFLSQSIWAVLGMVASVGLDYLAVRLILLWEQNEPRRRACMWGSVLKNILLILIFAGRAELIGVPHPLGLPIYALSAMACVLEVYRRQYVFTGGLSQFMVHCCFFPKLYAGPLTTWEEFSAQTPPVHPDLSRMALGGGRYLQGVFKAAILGSGLFALHRQLRQIGGATALSSWVLVFSVAYSLYFVLSGFSDMAQGLGELFGLQLPNNFYYPYQSRSMADFFQRFNMTVSRYIRRFVYVELGEGKSGRVADSINILMMGMLMGLWFGLQLNYLLWGAYLALFVGMERYLYPKLLQKMPTLFARGFTLCAVLSSFTIFSCDSLAESGRLIASMLNFSPLYNDEVLYLITSNWLLLAVSCFFATNAVNLVVTKFRRLAPVWATVVLGVADAGILILYLALAL